MAKFSRAPRSSVQWLVGSTSPAAVRRRSASAWARPAVQEFWIRCAAVYGPNGASSVARLLAGAGAGSRR